MTALMASLGLLPAALSQAVGAETARPFATVIVGGLVTATAITLFVLPLLYSYFEKEMPAVEEPPGGGPGAGGGRGAGFGMGAQGIGPIDWPRMRGDPAVLAARTR